MSSPRSNVQSGTQQRKSRSSKNVAASETLASTIEKLKVENDDLKDEMKELQKALHGSNSRVATLEAGGRELGRILEESLSSCSTCKDKFLDDRLSDSSSFLQTELSLRVSFGTKDHTLAHPSSTRRKKQPRRSQHRTRGSSPVEFPNLLQDINSTRDSDSASAGDPRSGSGLKSDIGSPSDIDSPANEDCGMTASYAQNEASVAIQLPEACLDLASSQSRTQEVAGTKRKRSISPQSKPNSPQRKKHVANQEHVENTIQLEDNVYSIASTSQSDHSQCEESREKAVEDYTLPPSDLGHPSKNQHQLAPRAEDNDEDEEATSIHGMEEAPRSHNDTTSGTRVMAARDIIE